MPGSQLQFERVYDLPPEIVWDALVDSDLVSGWLAEADVEPRVGGRFDLRWTQFDGGHETVGEISELEAPHLLVVESNNIGRSTLELIELGEGPRGRSTLLTVTVDALADRQFTAAIAATWRLSLEQLTELLHGHPVDWSRWREERAAHWLALLEAARI
jgi:uncharacterized protein YndB with AHSA1/START domain